MLHNTIDTAGELRNEFIKYDRDYYSMEAYQAMLEDMEEFDIELDVIALCCDYNEEAEDDIRDEHNIDEDEDVMEYLNNHTTAYRLTNSIIYCNF